MTKKTIIANWKMNKSFDEAEIWVRNLNKKLTKQDKASLPEIILCPPAVMIDYIDGLLMEKELETIEKLHQNFEKFDEKELENLITNLRIIQLGSQNCSSNENGSFTGEISAKMLKDCGSDWIILGHSESRLNHNESNEMVSLKIALAVKENLTPILCIGESFEQRKSGDYQNFIALQLQNSLPKNLSIKNLIIAYEPIWAIGSGKTPTFTEIEEIANLISGELQKNQNIANFKVIYGGSVNGENAGEIMRAKKIDGLLVGGASLNEEEFFKIIQSA